MEEWRSLLQIICLKPAKGKATLLLRPIFESVDNLGSFSRPGHEKVVTSMHDLVVNAATSETVRDLAFDKDRGPSLDARNLQDIIGALNSIQEKATKLFKGMTQSILDDPSIQAGLELERV
jgi:hypothetical protein